MKQIIKLTESDLRNMIKETIKKTLKEDYWDDEESYFNPHADMDAEMSHAEGILQKIEDGDYDKVLKNIDDPYDYFDVDIDAGYDLDGAINDRLSVIDKGYAMKYGWPNNRDNGYHPDANNNVKDYKNYHAAMSDSYWDEHDKEDNNEYLYNKFPRTFTKKGKLRKGYKDPDLVRSRVEKDAYGTDQADKRPLHRKGSLNRAFEESKHRAKVRRIVKECIGY